MRLTICADMDGVFADFVYGLSTLAWDMGFGKRPLTGKDVKKWNFMENIYTNPQIERLWSYIGVSEDFWQTLPPASVDLGDCTLHKILADKSIDFYILTSRYGNEQSVRAQTSNWFSHFMNVHMPHSRVIICKREEKLPILQKMHASIFIDDSPETIEEVANSRCIEKLFGMDYSYNNHLKEKLPSVNWVRTAGEFFLNLNFSLY